MRYQSKDTVEAFQVPFRIVVDVDGTQRIADPTDWIVRYPNGSLDILNAAEFSRRYEPPKPAIKTVEKEYVPYPVPYPARPYPWYQGPYYVTSQRTSSGELPVKIGNVTSGSNIRLLAQSTTDDAFQPGGPAVAQQWER